MLILSLMKGEARRDLAYLLCDEGRRKKRPGLSSL
jgi:hypothetical protein